MKPEIKTEPAAPELVAGKKRKVVGTKVSTVPAIIPGVRLFNQPRRIVK